MKHDMKINPGHTALVGLQWGDEGKGKIVDILTAKHDVIVRYNGGANAGHSVVIGDQRYALHLIPVGILSPKKLCVIGNGVVVDPEVVLREMEQLRGRGIAVEDNLLISDRAHVVMPYHKVQDAALEEYLASAVIGRPSGLSIGTTRRGIGPAYADKVHRSTAVRMGDLLDKNYLAEKMNVICAIRDAELKALGVDTEPLNAKKLTDTYFEMGQRLKAHITDTTYLLHDLSKQGKRFLFEGANACLLDIDHGTYPYVTSSNCSALGIPAGTGLPGAMIGDVYGIMKAYTTRVGAGPFPTELDAELAHVIRERGREYGTTTGRPRRVGWLDLVAVRYSAMICGATKMACMLLDVLSGLDTLKICTAYQLKDGTRTDRFIPDARRLEGAKPVYEEFEGWDEPIDGLTDRHSLPSAAHKYLSRVEEVVGVPIEFVSVGPERLQTLVAAGA